jgi:Cu+-exporting ATPase
MMVSTSSTTGTGSTTGARSTTGVDLLVGGMTCASCVSRVEKKLNRIDGVHASVNLATASAHVEYDAALVDEATLLDTVAATGYSATLASGAPPEDLDAGEAQNLLLRLTIAAPLTVAVLVLAMAPGLPRLPWLQLVLTVPVVAYAGWPFHRAAFVNARHLASTMDTLVSLGTLVAFGWSVVSLVSGNTDSWFELAATVTTLLVLGRWLEAQARSRAGSALRALLQLGAKRAVLLDDGEERDVDVADLRPGMQVLIRPGSQVPTDSRVVDGRSSVDESMLTGESLPAQRVAGDELIGGTLNHDGRLIAEVTRVGRDTTLARIGEMVSRAQASKAPVQRLADRISGVFVPVVLGIAAATFAVWILTGNAASEAMTAAVSVLVIACPCALGLATPTALLAGTGRAAQLGIVIRSASVLESTRRITSVVLDKTGTLTTAEMTVQSVAGDSEAVGLAATLEAASEHPIARAITSYVEPRGRLEEFTNVQGEGVRGVIDGTEVAVIRAPEPSGLPDELASAVRAARAAGRTAVLVRVGGQDRAVIAIGDTIKPQARRTVERLHALGLQTVLLTGDHPAAARQVAEETGIGSVIAGVLPEGKVEAIHRLQAAGEVVAMVGDGVNDAAALVAADLGLAMGTGTHAAIEAGDITLVSGDPALVADAITLSRRTLRVIRQNLFWAFAYNVVGIPIAAMGLLSPMVSGGAMALSSVCVVTNSLRLRRFVRGA